MFKYNIHVDIAKIYTLMPQTLNAIAFVRYTEIVSIARKLPPIMTATTFEKENPKYI